jgi:hypothetical protein
VISSIDCPDSRRALAKRLGLRVLALGAVQHREVVQARCHGGMIRVEGLLPDSRRALAERLDLRVLALGAVQHCEVVQARSPVLFLTTILIY